MHYLLRPASLDALAATEVAICKSNRSFKQVIRLVRLKYFVSYEASLLSSFFRVLLPKDDVPRFDAALPLVSPYSFASFLADLVLSSQDVCYITAIASSSVPRKRRL